MELSSYPARCVLGLERRTLPGETARGRRGASSPALLDRCRAADPALRGRAADAARARAVRGRPRTRSSSGSSARPRPRSPARRRPIGGASYWADAAFIAAAGIPTVMFGPGGEGAHAAEEWVSLADTEAVARTLVAVAARVCA